MSMSNKHYVYSEYKAYRCMLSCYYADRSPAESCDTVHSQYFDSEEAVVHKFYYTSGQRSLPWYCFVRAFQHIEALNEFTTAAYPASFYVACANQKLCLQMESYLGCTSAGGSPPSKAIIHWLGAVISRIAGGQQGWRTELEHQYLPHVSSAEDRAYFLQVLRLPLFDFFGEKCSCGEG